MENSAQDTWAIVEVGTYVRAPTEKFTEKTLDAPVTGILPDQVVTIKVEISFS
jgi:hypothetical protein